MNLDAGAINRRVRWELKMAKAALAGAALLVVLA